MPNTVLSSLVDGAAVGDVRKLVAAFLVAPSSVTYTAMSDALAAFKTANSTVNGFRILITTADGTVAYDSGKSSSMNVYGTSSPATGYVGKAINENHNSRVAILTALLSSSGVGEEQKWSTSSSKFENYLAIRVGISPFASIGCIRLSFLE